MGRKVLKGLFWILIVVMLLLPLGLIYQITTAEMEEYAASDSPIIRQSSIGTPIQATRMDLDLYVTVSGSFISTEVAFMDLNYKKPYDIRWIVSYGDEIQVGQVLGYYYGEEVISTLEGTVRNIATSTTDAYIMVDCFSPLVLECSVDDTVLNSLRQFSDTLTLEDGTNVTVDYIAKTKKTDGTTVIHLSLNREGDSYGTAVKDMIVYLGTSYPQVLVLPLDCVYQKEEGEDKPWYVREVSKDGFLISEKQVTVSYSNSTMAVVSGIEEGQWFDSGYKVVVSGDGE